jgi:hypothetical protein
MQRIATAVFAATLSIALPAFAHPNHDDPMDPRTRTQPMPAKPSAKYAVEAVTKDGATRVSISRDGARVPTANAMGVLVIEGRSPRVEYVLQPAADGTLVTREKPNLTPGTRATVAVSLADRTSIQESVTVR